MNEESLVALRKYNRNIELSGGAMILFSIWAELKILLPALVGQQKIEEIIGITGEEVVGSSVVGVAITIFVFGYILIFHFRLGREAIKYGRGIRQKKGFLVRAFILLIINIISVPFYFFEEYYLADIDTLIASLLVDITNISILLDMIISTFKADKIRKSIQAEK